MVTPKKRGANFEYKVAHLFQSLGYSWDRSGSSLGVDLKVYMRGRLKFLVNCKKTSTLNPIYVSKSEIESLKAKSREMGARGMICFGFRRTPVLCIPLEQVRGLPQTSLFYKLLPGSGFPLKKILGGKLFRKKDYRG